MNIFYDYQIFQNQIYGGPSKYFIELIKAVNENNKNIKTKIIAPFYINKFLKSSKNLDSIGIYINKKYSFRLTNYFNKFFFEKYINLKKPDLIHQTYYSNPKIKLGPTVLTVYDLIHEKFQSDFKVEFPKKKSLINADHIICISQNTKKDLMDIYRIDEKKISVIYLASGIKLTKQSYTENFLLYVGSRKRYKNFRIVLEALSRKKFKNNLVLKCFGGGPLLKEEVDYIKKLNFPLENIKIIDGNDTDLHSELNKAYALIYPSKYEGFGLPILEAMSLGCPVISSNSSSLPEVYGDAALNFDPNNVTELEKRIQDLLNDNSMRNNLIDKGFKRVKKFSWEKCANETIKVYKKVVG